MRKAKPDLDRSYLIMALLDVCAFTADHLSDNPVERDRIAGNLAQVIRHTQELTGKMHDDLETLISAVQP